MSRSPRSSHSRNEEHNFSDELDDILAAPALKPSLRFLGLKDSETATSAVLTAPAASPARSGLTASPAITAGDAVVSGDAVRARKKRIHRCVKVQDGHSHVEQAVYQILWNAGAAQPEGTRICRLGLPRIAKEACVHERNIGMILRRLIQKRAVEVAHKEACELRTARTYRVFGYRDILERRKEAGLEWVVRGRGVEFVNPDTGQPLFRDQDLIIGRVTAGDAVIAGDAVTASDPPAVTAGGSPAVTPGGSPAVTAGLLGSNTGNTSEETSSSSIFPVVAALRSFGAADDEVARKLMAACRSHAPDCTPEEVVHFIEQKGALTRQERLRISHPIGFLLAAVPKCLTGEAFRLYREDCRRAREELDRRARQRQTEIDHGIGEQRAVLADPGASEEDKRFARQLLGLDLKSSA